MRRNESLTQFFIETILGAAQNYGTSELNPYDAREFFAIPDEAMERQILDHFKMSKEDFKKAVTALSRNFMKLWYHPTGYFQWDPEEGFIHADGLKFKATPFLEGSRGEEYTLIHGFISSDKLNEKLMAYRR